MDRDHDHNDGLFGRAAGRQGGGDMSVKAILVDVDGTLVDTTYLHTVAWWQALIEYGHTVPMSRVHRAIGMGADMILDHLLGPDHDKTDDEAIAGAHSALAAVHWPTLRATNGAADLLRVCKARGLTVVLASSAQERELTALRTAIDADDAVTDVTSADDAARSKPAADIVGAALERAGVRPEEAVFVGDAVWDAYAAKKAGVTCIGVSCGGTSRADLTEAGMAEVYDDPAHLVTQLDLSRISRG
jgi:HAD superfamily hydrolase (TIGR01509 family)